MDTLRAKVCLTGRDAIRIPKRAIRVVQGTDRVRDAVKGGNDKNANILE